MSNQKISNITERLESLLADERELMRAMDVAGLAGRSTQKLALVKSLEETLINQGDKDVSGTVEDALSRIAKLAMENDQHFRAVREGLSNVIVRVSDYAGGADTGAYNQHGEQIKLRGASGPYLRKA